MMQTSTQQHSGPSPHILESIRTFARSYEPCKDNSRVVVLYEETPLPAVGEC